MLSYAILDPYCSMMKDKDRCLSPLPRTIFYISSLCDRDAFEKHTGKYMPLCCAVLPSHGHNCGCSSLPFDCLGWLEILDLIKLIKNWCVKPSPVNLHLLVKRNRVKELTYIMRDFSFNILSLTNANLILLSILIWSRGTLNYTPCLVQWVHALYISWWEITSQGTILR